MQHQWFYVFAGNLRPDGGIADLQGQFTTLGQAQTFIHVEDQLPFDWWHIVTVDEHGRFVTVDRK